MAIVTYIKDEDGKMRPKEIVEAKAKKKKPAAKPAAVKKED